MFVCLTRTDLKDMFALSYSPVIASSHHHDLVLICLKRLTRVEKVVCLRQLKTHACCAQKIIRGVTMLKLK